MASNIHIPKGLKHSAWSVFDAAIYPLVYMAAMPVLMKGLGAVAFGFWVVLNTIIITLQLFNLNIGLTTVRQVSYYIAKGDFNEVSKLVNALLQITLIMLLTVVLAGIIIAYVIPKYNLLQLTDAPVNNVALCLFLAALIAGLKFFDLVFNSLLKASEKFKTSSILNTINRTGLLLLNVFLAVNSYSVQHLLWANIVYAILYLMVQTIVLRKVFTFYKFSLHLEKTWYKPLLRFSIYPWLQFLIIVIAFQTDRFWVSSFAGLQEVSAYGLTATIFNHVHMIFTAMAAWILPRIATMVAKGADPSGLYYTVRGGLLGLTTLSLLLFYLIYPYIFQVWAGKEIYRSMSVYIKAFIAFELVFVHTIMPFFYLNAAGKERLATVTTLIFSSLSYVLMIAGLYILKHPVYLIHGMTLAMCITMPLINKLVWKAMQSDKHSHQLFLAEMLPLYVAILALYVPYPWLSYMLLLIVLVLLYRSYLSQIIVQKLWKQPVRS